MAIVKSLSQAPMGLDNEVMDIEPDIEIEIEDPERVSIETGGLEIVIEPGEEDDEFSANLVEGELTTIGLENHTGAES